MTETYAITGSIRRSLADIGAHWDAMLVPSSSAGQGGAATTRITADDHAETEADIDRATRVVSLRREVLDVLNAISRWVMEDRPVTKALPDGLSVPSLIEFIDRHADWIAERDADDNEYETGRLKDLANKVTKLVAPPRKEWHYLGDCPFIIEDWFCAGRVRVPIGGDQSQGTCTDCEQIGLVPWWEDVLGVAVAEESVRASDMARILAERLEVTITERTVRNWARDERISVVPQFGPQPNRPRYWFSPRAVVDEVARMDRDCPMCGRIWSGEGEVCPACWYAMQYAAPSKAKAKAPTRAPIPLLPRKVVVPDSHDTDRPERCHWSDLPTNQCACGRHAAEIVDVKTSA